MSTSKGQPGSKQRQCKASLHVTSAPGMGKIATLYLSAGDAAADKQWQDLVVLLGMLALTHELISRNLQNNASPDATHCRAFGSDA